MSKLLSKDILPLRGVRGVERSIMAQYQEYAFINNSVNGKGEDRATEGVVEAITQWEHLMEAIIRRSYERPIQWYYIVFKPYNAPYGRDPDFFKVKGLDKCRKILRAPQAYILTRETDAEKVHVNMLVATSQDLLSLHDQSYCSKYKLSVQSLRTLGDRRRVLTYLLKESKTRTFIKYLDYIHYERK